MCTVNTSKKSEQSEMEDLVQQCVGRENKRSVSSIYFCAGSWSLVPVLLKPRTKKATEVFSGLSESRLHFKELVGSNLHERHRVINTCGHAARSEGRPQPNEIFTPTDHSEMRRNTLVGRSKGSPTLQKWFL